MGTPSRRAKSSRSLVAVRQHSSGTNDSSRLVERRNSHEESSCVSMRRRRLLLGSRIGDQCDDVALSVFKRVPRAVIGGTLVTSPGSPAKQFGLVDWIRFFYDYFLREVYEAQQLRSAVRVFRCHTTTTQRASLPACLGRSHTPTAAAATHNNHKQRRPATQQQACRNSTPALTRATSR